MASKGSQGLVTWSRPEPMEPLLKHVRQSRPSRSSGPEPEPEVRVSFGSVARAPTGFNGAKGSRLEPLDPLLKHAVFRRHKEPSTPASKPRQPLVPRPDLSNVNFDPESLSGRAV